MDHFLRILFTALILIFCVTISSTYAQENKHFSETVSLRGRIKPRISHLLQTSQQKQEPHALDSKPYWVFGLKYQVNIINGFENSSEPLIVHCQSKDNDLGVHPLQVGEDFHWHFKVNVWGTTQFYCNVTWDQKVKHFDAFQAEVEGYYCGDNGNGRCFWLVAEAGFYFSTDDFTWEKRFDWE